MPQSSNSGNGGVGGGESAAGSGTFGAGRRKNPGNPGLTLVVVLYGLALGLSTFLVLKPQYFEVGVAGALLVLTLSPIAYMLAASSNDRRYRAMTERIEELTRSLRTLTDQSILSNDARKVLNRQTERVLLRSAIEEDIANRNWDAAMILVKELAEGFGYRVPELHAADPATETSVPTPYPAACRPQAWSAAAAVVCLEILED